VIDATNLVLIGAGLQFAASAAPIVRSLPGRLRLRVAPIALLSLTIATAPRT
jgi:hypothetical protein